MVKIETRHPIEGSLGSEFTAIYNHCEVMAALSRKALKIYKFLRFFKKKRHLTVKFSKFCSKSFHCMDRRVVFKFREIWPTENRALPTQRL